MAIYDFKCGKCQRLKVDVVMPISHRSSERPMCCDQLMNYYITSVPMVMWKDPIIEPFKPVATANAPVITTTRQHRDYMKRNDLVDANELFTPPTREEEMAAVAEAQESIAAITPTAEQKQQLKESGLDSILEE